MFAVLFDFGNTLADDDDNALPGAAEMLAAAVELRDPSGARVPIGLVSDYLPPTQHISLEIRKEEYYASLRHAGLNHFFEPLDGHVTLSSEVGVTKPDRRIFEAAVRRIEPGGDLHQTIFVTENAEHVRAAREMGMKAIHLKGPGQTSGEVNRLVDLAPLLQRMVQFAPCCKKPSQAVGRKASAASKSNGADPGIADLVGRVSGERLQTTIRHLVDFGTRWSYSPEIAKVPNWIGDRFRAAGYPNKAIRFQPFDMTGAGPQKNVLCGPDRESPGMVLLCAHYDSISETPSTHAPGADDNATGIAALLELAQLLHGVSLRRGVLFAGFGGEEQGLFGSAACADVAASEDWKIDVVVNMDMIGFQDPARPHHVVVEYDQGNKNPANDAAAKAFGMLMAQAAADYTSLTVEHTDIWNSDYMPFEAKGYACIGVYEAGQNPNYHKSTDLMTPLQMSHLVEVTKMVLATVYQIAH